MSIAEENKVLDLKALHADRKRLFVLYADLETDCSKAWLVDRMLGAGELSAFYGPPGCGKGVIIEDMGLHIAAGLEWHGKPVTRGAVLYVALERRKLVERRAIAFRVKHGLQDLPFAIAGGVYDFRNPTTAAQILDICREVERQTGERVVLIIVDTVSRALAGGDENSPKDMGALVTQLHNGSFESRTVGTQNSPMARTPSGVSQVYPPPVRGHYDENYQFVPDVPTYNGLGPGSIAGPGSTGASIPATNDYEFAGRKNPAGPYQEGISAPLSFPQYNKDRLQNLPSEYPDGVPLPQSRPPEAGPGQQSSLPSTQDVASLGSAFQSLIESISASINSAKGSTVTNPESNGIQGEGEQGSSQVSDLGDSVEKVDGALDELATSVGDAASNIEGKSQGEPTYAATGGLITGPGSTTSDSIPAMLSNKEFVVNADATQKHLGLLTALNAGKEIGFKHFAIGGPVGVMGDVGLPSVPSAAIASMASPWDVEHLGSVDLNTPHGNARVVGERDVLRSMTSAARDAGVSQTGPRPGWYQGS